MDLHPPIVNDPAVAIEAIAAALEHDLQSLSEAWAGLAGEDRPHVARGLSVTAPGVLRMLCPHYGLFGAVS